MLRYSRKVRRAIYLKSGAVVNTVFAGNTVKGVEHDLSVVGGTITYSRSVDLTDGVDGNITADPRVFNLKVDMGACENQTGGLVLMVK